MSLLSIIFAILNFVERNFLSIAIEVVTICVYFLGDFEFH